WAALVADPAGARSHDRLLLVARAAEELERRDAHLGGGADERGAADPAEDIVVVGDEAPLRAPGAVLDFVVFAVLEVVDDAVVAAGAAAHRGIAGGAGLQREGRGGEGRDQGGGEGAGQDRTDGAHGHSPEFNQSERTKR